MLSDVWLWIGLALFGAGVAGLGLVMLLWWTAEVVDSDR